MMNANNPATPGVYIVEKNAFPNSIVEVATAIPAFIGYTQRASYNGQSLAGQAVKVTSMVDYVTYFGAGPAGYLQFALGAPPSPLPAVPSPLNPVLTINQAAVGLAVASGNYYMYNAVRLFYQNGGGTCYIISMGFYGVTASLADFYPKGLAILANQQDPTMVVMPDALLLSAADYTTAMQQALLACQGSQNRVAILDVYGGAVADPLLTDALVTSFRTAIGINALNYGAAYFPWLQTGIVQGGEITFANFPNGDLSKYFETTAPLSTALATIQSTLVAPANTLIKTDQYMLQAATQAAVTQAHNALYTASPNYKAIILAAMGLSNVLPPSSAMAGIYTYVDNLRGVWKAPANVSLTNVVAPTVNLNDDQQASFNVDAATGKSINVIRAFTGQGVLVWGARMLDGNSQDWRYVSVRRTLIMIEQSVKLAARSYVFEPNDANTWATVKSMISNFLNGLWKQGALAGAKPDDAYSVSVGLGSTMTGDDVLNGVMNITVLVAVSHPAEFIIITFQQQMQKS